VGSGLQEQQTEPVHIHCQQLHSHTSYVCKLVEVCNIQHSAVEIQILIMFCGSHNWFSELFILKPNSDKFSDV